MIYRNGRWMNLLCDECGGESDEFDDFEEMVIESKGEGWKIYQLRGVWKHECPDCIGTGNLERQRALFR